MPGAQLVLPHTCPFSRPHHPRPTSQTGSLRLGAAGLRQAGSRALQEQQRALERGPVCPGLQGAGERPAEGSGDLCDSVALSSSSVGCLRSLSSELVHMEAATTPLTQPDLSETRFLLV